MIEWQDLVVRAKDALAVARVNQRRSGVAGGTASAKVQQRAARRRALRLVPILAEIRAVGIVSNAKVARALNLRGVKCPRGGQWRARTVAGVLDRLPPSLRPMPAQSQPQPAARPTPE